MIAATICVKDDGDIVGDTVRNMLEQGVDRVWAYTTGAEAFAAIADLGSRDVWAIRNNDPLFHQAEMMNRLAEMASRGRHGDELEWVCPFDADEFWFSLDGRTVAETLRAMPESIGKVWATLWHHQTWDEKVVPAERLHKVAYRWAPGARVHMGNHDVDLPAAAEQGALPALQIRHFQFRSYAQFRSKVATWCERLPPENKARGDVAHLTQHEGASDVEMEIAWRALCARPTVHDPIPYQR